MAEDPRDVVRRMLDEVKSRLDRCHKLLRPFEEAAVLIVKRIQEMDASGPFLKPVSRASVPLYYEKIKKPMCLNEVSRKLNNHQYETLLDFAEDLRLIVRNCHTFNQFDGELCKAAREMEILFEMMLVEDAGLPKPDIRSFAAMYQTLSSEKKAELARVVSAYEGLQSGRITVVPAKMKIATQRAFARFLEAHVSAEMKAQIATAARPATPAKVPPMPPRSMTDSVAAPRTVLGGGGLGTSGGPQRPANMLGQGRGVHTKDDQALLREVQQRAAPPPVSHSYAERQAQASPLPPSADAASALAPLGALQGGQQHPPPVMKQNRHSLAEVYHAPSPVQSASGSETGSDDSDFSSSEEGDEFPKPDPVPQVPAAAAAAVPTLAKNGSATAGNGYAVPAAPPPPQPQHQHHQQQPPRPPPQPQANTVTTISTTALEDDDDMDDIFHGFS